MNELDEPKVGDQVLLLSLDPLYNSYFIYRKLKENDFIGFRASGKIVDITPDYVTLGVFDENLDDYSNDAHWNDDKIKNSQITSLTIDKEGTVTLEAAKKNGSEGNLNVYLKGDTSIEIHGPGGNNIKISSDSNVKISGNSKVEVTGNSELNVSGSCTIKCNSNVKISALAGCDINSTGPCNISSSSACTVSSPNTTLKGPGQLTLSGVTATGSQPFCNLPACIITGVQHSIGTVMTT